MNRRTFLLLPCDGSGGFEHKCAIPRWSAVSCSPFRVTTAAIRRFAPSGGTSPPGARRQGPRLRHPRLRSPARDPASAEGSASAFAPSQLLFAHAAVADPAFGRLRHDQRGAAGFGLAQASEQTTDVAIGDWRLRLRRHVHDTGDRARIRVLARVSRRTAALARRAGRHRKGPSEAQASFYYSRPHLAVKVS